MPTYSYHCDGCGGDFEKEQRITEAPVRKCPACGKLRARRMISGGSFILKGGGWYSDAYGLKPEKKVPATVESTSSSSSSGGKSGTDGGPKDTGGKAAASPKPTATGS